MTLTTVFDLAQGGQEDGVEVVMRHLLIGLHNLHLHLAAPPPVAPSVLSQPLVLTLQVRASFSPHLQAPVPPHA